MVQQSSKCPSREQPSHPKRSNGDKGKKSNMKVVVRVRPPNCMEIAKQSAPAVRVMDDRVLVFDPKEDTVNYVSGDQRRIQPRLWKRRARDLRFMFDRVFDDKGCNGDIFEHTTKSIVDGVLDGYNCTVFAYGATGAGKTFTMLGDSSQPGVMFLTMMELYSRINACKHEKTCDVAVSYLEVYNETIRDLLMPGQALAVREDPQKGVCVTGLTLHKPSSAEELLGMLEFGNNNRTQHPTDANAQSSRSHAVFQVFVRQKDRTAGLKANFAFGKMSLIDLAGSERAIVTSNRGERFREGANINKSLLALGNCINALADKENKAGHIPYRDSKLTRLLKDSLGGNCRTVMIAAISPSSLSYEDTYNTLKYADRAMNIKCKIVKNELSVDLHVSRYAKIVEELRVEISELKSKIFQYESGDVPAKKALTTHSQTHSEIERLRSSLKSILKEQRMAQRDMTDIKVAERDLQVKLLKKERNLKRMQVMCVEGEKLEQAFSKTQSCLSATKNKQKYLSSKQAEVDEKIAKNNEWLERIQKEMKLYEYDKEMASQAELCRTALQSEMDCLELKKQCQLYKRHIRSEEKDAQNTERLVLKLLGMVRKQFFVLKGFGLATQDLTDEYEDIVDTLERGREVTWADQTPKENSKTDNSSFTFQSINIGTPSHTPIRIRQFNTPNINNSDATPIRTGSISRHLMKNFSHQGTPVGDDLPEVCMSLTKEFDAEPSPTNISQKKSTLNPKVCWNGNPTTTDCSTPQRVTLSRQLESKPSTSQTKEVDLSGILPLRNTSKADNNNSQMPSTKVSSKKPEGQNLLCTPLRVLAVNNQNAPRDQLSSVICTQNNNVKKDQVKKQMKGVVHKMPSEMIPKRVGISAKENYQLLGKPSRSHCSSTELTSLSLKKVNKHISGLRRTVSATNVVSQRQFAPRLTLRNNDQVENRPRWQ